MQWIFQARVFVQQDVGVARVSLDYDVLIGPRVIGKQRWEWMKREHSSFYHNVAAEGIPFSG
jgi:hypothetical protein